MSFRERKKLLLAKAETTYGVDATPTGAADAILTKNLQRTIYNGNRVSRDLNLPYMGNDESINVAPNVTVTFDIELAGSGSAGDVSQLDVLLRACALSSTVVADASVTYAAVSEAFESCTLYFNYDGEVQKVVGARGTAVLNMTAGALPVISFTMTGRYAKPSIESLPTPTYNAIAPLPFSSYNTETFTVHGQAVKGQSISLDLGNQVVHRNLAGYDGIDITDRAPTGTVVFEATTVATKDYFAAMESHNKSPALGAIQIIHGGTAGNIVTLNVPTAQLSNITETEVDGIRMFSAEYIPVPTAAGNNELTVAFT